MNFLNTACRSAVMMTALVAGSNADTFVLKDGTRIEGTILREDATNYVLEVQVTKSIKDERTVAKADVVKVEGEKKDETAFESLAALVPVPDALSADEYSARIGMVEKFLKDYPSSAKAKQARAILETLKREANEVLAGGIKVNGKIITAAEYRANALDIDASIDEAKVRALLNQGHFLAGLRAFAEFEREFPNTNSRESLRPLVIQAINSYMAQISQLQATYDARLKERQTGLERMQMEDRRKTQAALAEEAAALEKRFKDEKAAKLGWVSVDPFYKPSIDDTLAFAKQEITRLTNTGSKPAVDAGTAFRDALRKIQNGSDATAKTAALGEAKTAMVSGKYLAILEAASR